MIHSSSHHWLTAGSSFTCACSPNFIQILLITIGLYQSWHFHCCSNIINDDSGVPVSHGSVAMSQHERYHHPATEAAKLNSGFINFIIYACVFPAVTVKRFIIIKHLSNVISFPITHLLWTSSLTLFLLSVLFLSTHITVIILGLNRQPKDTLNM